MTSKSIVSLFKTKSIIVKFRLALVIVYILSLIISILVINNLTRQEVYNNAEKELNLLVNVVKSARTYIDKDVRPYLLPKDIFHAPAISPVVATKHIAEHFLDLEPSYYIKVTSDNPLNPDNRPEPIEQKILESFREDRNLESLIIQGRVQNNNYLISAQPSISQQSCLLCHSKPENSPPNIAKEYKGTSGYGYELDQVVGANVVGVPIGNVNQIIFQRSLTAFISLTILFSLIFFIINRLMQRLILKPIINLSHSAQEITDGNLDKEISLARQDEIGQLANSLDLMRRSIITATKRFKKLRDKYKQ